MGLACLAAAPSNAQASALGNVPGVVPRLAGAQEALARLDPLGAGLLPPQGFGSALVWLDAPTGAQDPAPTPDEASLDLVLVGAPADATAGHARGAVHVFLRRPGGFDRGRHLLPTTDPGHAAVLSTAERFGSALAALGASPGMEDAGDARGPRGDRDRPGPGAGPAARRGGGHGAGLRAGGPASGAGALVAVGAPGRDVGRAGDVVAAAGGVTLFRRVGGGGFQRVAELAAPVLEAGAGFGAAVALGWAASDGSPQRLAVVGAPHAATPGAFSAGAATLFAEGPVGVTGAPVWTVRAALAAPRPSVAGAFGAAVAIVEDAHGIVTGPVATCIAVAAPGDGAAGPGSGAVFLFDLEGRLLDVRRATHDVHRGQVAGARYGERLAALGGGRLAVAAPARGAVEVLRIEGGTMVREALLTASPAVGFGLGLAGAAGELLAVGAPFEGPEAPMPVPPPAPGAGRVHLFLRTGGVWCGAPPYGAAGPDSSGATAEPRDELGHALAFGRGGALLAVSAPGSDAACPDGTPCDAGAAFVLTARPPTRAFCPDDSAERPGSRGSTGSDGSHAARGALEVLGSRRASDGRLRFVIGGEMPGRRGVLLASLRTREPRGGSLTAVGCLTAPLHRLGAAACDVLGRWQLDAASELEVLERASPGSTWAFQVAWRGGGHSTGVAFAPVR